MSAQFTPGLEMLVSSTPSANGQFHLYLADANRRKVAALWGGNDEKMANGYLWSAASELYEALDPANVRTAAKLLTDAGHGLHAGLLILMADAQDRALAKARGQ